jgi:hypothetical protein
MYQTDYDEFKKTIGDLCVAVNRPFNDDLARVFWEDLKWLNLSDVRERAKYLRACGKTRFTSGDLRPEKAPPKEASDGPSVEDRLDAYVFRTKQLTNAQRLGSAWTYLYRGNPRTGEGLETTGVVIAADGDAPGYRVMVIDMLAEES